jgi:hypothetical protein
MLRWKIVLGGNQGGYEHEAKIVVSMSLSFVKIYRRKIKVVESELDTKC